MSLHKRNTAWSWWSPPSYLRHCNCDWLSHTTWSNEGCRRIPHGMVAAILFPVDQVMCDWLNHNTWFHSNRALPRSMEFESMLLNFVYTIQSPICYVGCLMIANTFKHGRIWMRQYFFIFLHNTDVNMLRGLFDDHKYMDIYLPIHQEYCYLGKQKKFVFFHIKLWTLVTFTPCKLCKMSAQSQ